MLNIVTFKPRREARISLAGSWEAQAKIKKIKDNLITLACLLENCGGNYKENDLKGMCYTMYHASVILNGDLFDLRKIVDEIEG